MIAVCRIECKVYCPSLGTEQSSDRPASRHGDTGTEECHGTGRRGAAREKHTAADRHPHQGFQSKAACVETYSG